MSTHMSKHICLHTCLCIGEAEQNELTQKLMVALKLNASEISATRHTDNWASANTGALGHGKIYHPTKVYSYGRYSYGQHWRTRTQQDLPPD